MRDFGVCYLFLFHHFFFPNWIFVFILGVFDFFVVVVTYFTRLSTQFSYFFLYSVLYVALASWLGIH